MSRFRDWARSVVRRTPSRLLQKTRLNIETLESRALMSGLTFSAAYGISGSGVTVSDVATEPSGNSYVSGNYTGNANFGTDASGKVYAETDQSSLPEAFVVGYTPGGVVNWYAEFQNSFVDANSTSNAVSLTYDAKDQTVYVVGNFTGTVDFNPFGGEDVKSSSTYSAGPTTTVDASDVYIVGLNAVNGFLNTGLGADYFADFVMTESSNMSATPTQVTINPVGDSVYVTGYYTNTDTADYPKGTITVGDQGGEAVTLVPPPGNSLGSGTEGFSATFNLNLVLDWAVNTWNGSSGTLDDALNFGIAPAPQAGIDYVVGDDVDATKAFVETIHDTDGSYAGLVELPTSDMSTTDVDLAVGVVTDSMGNAYVVGTFSGTLTLGLSQELTSEGATNSFIVSFGPKLNELWADRFGSSNQSELNDGIGDDGDAVGIDGAGTPDIYVSGEDEGPSTYGTSSMSVIGQNSANVEAYVIEVSSSTGNFISAFGATGSGTSTSEAESLAVSSNGQVAIIGSYTAPTTLGTVSLTTGNHVFISNLTGTPPAIDLAITMTDQATTYAPAGSTTYTIVVSNNGPGAVTGAMVNDALAASNITSDTWMVTATTLGASVTTSSGTGSIANDVVSLVAGATVTFTVTVQISSSATGNLFNVATVTTPAGVTDTNIANNAANVNLTAAPPLAPKFVREQRISKGTSKKALFKLIFNGPLNAGFARSTAHYRAAQKSGTRSCRRK